MEPRTSARLERLQELARGNPAHCFTWYGIAMELKSLGRKEEAVEVFRKILTLDQGYVMAYQHGGYLLRDLGRIHEAKALFERGVTVARAAGNKKAEEEIGAALSALEAGPA